MDFFLQEAGDDTPTLLFSDEDDDDDTSNFIDDPQIEGEGISFYKDLTNLNHYPKFQGQTKNPIEATYLDVESYFGEVEQPEPFAPENRDNVEFDKFEKSAENFKKTLLRFDGVEKHLFFPVIYRIMYHKNTDTENIKREDAQKILGESFYFDLLEIEPKTMLDKSLFGFFQRCFSINKVISKQGFFLRFFERRNMYIFLMKKS